MHTNETVGFREAVAVWWRIGLLSFGGPAGQIALMHRMIVEERGWLDETRFLHALNYCILLPGPEAQQLATYIGWQLHGVRGGLVAGTLFILPGAVAMLALSWLYVLVGDTAAVTGLFFGLKAAVIAIVAQALVRIARRALHGLRGALLAAAGFLALSVFAVPFPLVVLGAGLIGFGLAGPTRAGDAGDAGNIPLTPTRQARSATRRAALACASLWGLTLLALFAFAGDDQTFTRIAVFFSKLAVVTFGGAYAVLAYVAQQGVEQYQWLAPGEMLDGLGLAETTPGPLILVTQFVGFLAAYRAAAPEYALLAGSAGALLTVWVTFLPCFLWIFAGAPYVEKLRSLPALAAALAAITAAVVGVIANLAVWFGFNFLFAEQSRHQAYGMDLLLPVAASVDLPALVLALVAVGLVFGARLGLAWVLLVSAALGVGWTVMAG